MLPISTVLTMRGTVAVPRRLDGDQHRHRAGRIRARRESQIAWEAHIGGFVVGFFLKWSSSIAGSGSDAAFGPNRTPS